MKPPLPGTGAPLATWRLLPALTFLTYLVTTVVLFFFGPWRWPVTNPRQVAGYLAVAVLAIAAGAFAGGRVKAEAGRFPRAWLVSLAVGVVGINLLLLPLTQRASTGRWLPDLWTAVRSPGEVYLDSWRLRESAGHWIWYLRILLGPAMGLLLPLMVVERRRLPRLLVVAGGLAICGEIVLAVATGTNRAFGNVSLLLPWLILGGHVSGQAPFRSRKEAAGVTLVLLVLWVGFAAFFQHTMASRRGAPAKTRAFSLGQRVEPPTVGGAAPGRPPSGPPQDHLLLGWPPYAPITLLLTDPVAPSVTPALAQVQGDHLLLRWTPRFSHTGVLGITSYLTQGYYALGLALDQPFVPMWGAGHSVFLSRQVARLPGLADFPQRSYPVRIEKMGWDAYGKWSSVFPWWASDVGFPGALVVVALVGVGFVASWREVLAGTSNPFAAAAFCQFAIFLAYVPANNQCLQSGEGLTAFWGIALGWLAFRGRGGA